MTRAGSTLLRGLLTYGRDADDETRAINPADHALTIDVDHAAGSVDASAAQFESDGFHSGLRVNVAAGLIADAGFPDRLESLLHEHETDPELLTRPGSTLNGWYTLPFGELKIDRAPTADLGNAAGAETAAR